MINDFKWTIRRRGAYAVRIGAGRARDTSDFDARTSNAVLSSNYGQVKQEEGRKRCCPRIVLLLGVQSRRMKVYNVQPRWFKNEASANLRRGP